VDGRDIMADDVVDDVLPAGPPGRWLDGDGDEEEDTAAFVVVDVEVAAPAAAAAAAATSFSAPSTSPFIVQRLLKSIWARMAASASWLSFSADEEAPAVVAVVLYPVEDSNFP
jgi:hypothetical protein